MAGNLSPSAGCGSHPCDSVTFMCINHEGQVLTMSLGSYDEHEHERRERKSSEVDAAFDDERTVYHGSVEYDGEESTEELLDQFQQIND